jgi:hypothetical protein
MMNKKSRELSREKQHGLPLLNFRTRIERINSCPPMLSRKLSRRSPTAMEHVAENIVPIYQRACEAELAIGQQSTPLREMMRKKTT